MSITRHRAPFKLMITDLTRLEKLDNFWLCRFNGETAIPIKLSQVHIQGEISKTAGFFKEILIVSDGTAKAKVTRGPKVPGDFSWINDGEQCLVIGNLIDNGKLPHVAAIKIARITNPVLKEMWPLEVDELKNVILGKVCPELKEDLSD